MSSPTPSYSKRYIAFVDVLGFGRLVEESGTDIVAAPGIVSRVADAIERSFDDLDGDSEDRAGFRFTQFSDSFVLSIAVDDDEDQEGALFDFSLSLLGVIDNFLASGLLLRGGITLGQLVHTPKLLFGPAMNRAYHLESKLAKVPRIVLDPDIPELTQQLPLDGLLERDSDGLVYINYIRPEKVWFVAPEWLYAIQQAAEAMPQTPSLEEKRSWLVRKYNMVVSGFHYPAFKARLDAYIESADANNAVVSNYEEILADAQKIRTL